jgi:hypothetical protein
MPTLNWIGKDAVINHHKEVPFCLLKCRADLSIKILQILINHQKDRRKNC